MKQSNVVERNSYKKYKSIAVFALIISFFLFYLGKISYGLPYFWNPDEIEYQNSLLSVLYFASDQFVLSYNPIYAPILNVILILNSIFINEVLFNSLSLSEIKSKIYFNPEVFIFYGRLASLIIGSFSLFVLYLIFKKFKINFLISFILLITFATSLLMFNVSTIMGKNSSNLLIYLIQIYFFSKYLIKIEKFNSKSYLIFGLLAAFAWGVNYWPAFISMYAVLCLHLRKFKYTKINYLIIFSIIFIIFGPVLNLFFTDTWPGKFLGYGEVAQGRYGGISYFESMIKRIIISSKVIFFTDKNISLLIAFSPFFLINKNTKYKKVFLLFLLLFIEPIMIFGITGGIVPQLRYFGGILSVVVILTAIIFNELNKTNIKYFILFFLALNIYAISDNLTKIYKANNIIKKHTFINFNQDIKIDRSKILYLVDLNFQESLDQNYYYKDLFDRGLIDKNSRSLKFKENIEKKIQIIKNRKHQNLENPDLKKDIIYHNYTFFPIADLKKFFDFIKEDYEYVLIEESHPPYLSDPILQEKIKTYVKNNFELINIHQKKDKIFFRNQQSILHFFSNTLYYLDVGGKYQDATNADYTELYDRETDVVYGANFGLYKFK
jgi:hypothetical protein